MNQTSRNAKQGQAVAVQIALNVPTISSEKKTTTIFYNKTARIWQSFECSDSFFIRLSDIFWQN